MQPWRPIIVATLLGCFLSGAGGCARWELNWRRKHWESELREMSNVAYQRVLGKAPGDPDYAAGWREGYFRVLCGGDGQPPLVPPEAYWTPASRHQGAPAEIADWQRGYIDGAATALQQGRQGYATLPASPPRQGSGSSESRYPVSFRTERTPQGLPPRPLQERPATPRPLPPTHQQLDGQPDRENGEGDLPQPAPAEAQSERPAPQLDAAFRQLQRAIVRMPRAETPVGRDATPPPATRVASPFARISSPAATSVR